MTPAWLTLAADADLPLWVGCMVRAPHLPGSGLVVDIAGAVVWARWNDGRGVELRAFRPGEPPTPDLDHRPTRLEFVARLADRLGEPAEVAEQGVGFYEGKHGGWWLADAADRWSAEVCPGEYGLSRDVALVRAWIAAGKAG